MTSSAERTFSFSNWTATDSEIACSWLAYKELVSRKSVGPNIGDLVLVPLSKRGWERTWRWSFPLPPTNTYVAERILGNPYDFCVAYDAGMDIMADGGCLRPQDLPRILANERGQSNLDTMFTPEAETAAIQLFHTAMREAEKRRATERAKKPLYETTPSVFGGDSFTTYRIADGKVSIDRSIFGFKFGDRPEILIQDVKDMRRTGTIWGDIFFSNGSRDVVIWRKVFRPEATYQQVEQIIRAAQNRGPAAALQ